MSILKRFSKIVSEPLRNCAISFPWCHSYDHPLCWKRQPKIFLKLIRLRYHNHYLAIRQLQNYMQRRNAKRTCFQFNVPHRSGPCLAIVGAVSVADEPCLNVFKSWYSQHFSKDNHGKSPVKFSYLFLLHANICDWVWTNVFYHSPCVFSRGFQLWNVQNVV